MPFRSRELFEPKKCEKICSDIARHTDQIIRAFAKESKGLLYNLKSKELPDENFLEVLLAVFSIGMLLSSNLLVIVRRET